MPAFYIEFASSISSKGELAEEEDQGRREESRTMVLVEPIFQPSTLGSLPRSLPLAVDTEIRCLSSDVLRQLHIEPVETPVSVAQSSAKSIRPLLQSGFGTLGSKVTVAINHFPVRVSLPEIYHYDVSSWCRWTVSFIRISSMR